MFFCFAQKLVHGQVLLCFFFAQKASTWSSFVVLFSLAKFNYASIHVCNQICYKLLLHMTYDVRRLFAFFFQLCNCVLFLFKSKFLIKLLHAQVLLCSFHLQSSSMLESLLTIKFVANWIYSHVNELHVHFKSHDREVLCFY
jgi:hypothetical protein